jgi:hypothetical protein
MTMTKTWEAGVMVVVAAVAEAVGRGAALGAAGDCAVALGPHAVSRQIEMTRAANLICLRRYEANLKIC